MNEALNLVLPAIYIWIIVFCTEQGYDALVYDILYFMDDPLQRGIICQR